MTHTDSALPAKRDSFFQRVVEGLSSLRRHQIRGFQLVVPFRRRIGIIDKHQGRFVAQPHRLAFHRFSILRHENVCEVAKDGLGKWNPAEAIPRCSKVDAALLFTDRRNHGSARHEERSALDEFESLAGQRESAGSTNLDFVNIARGSRNVKPLGAE